MFEPGALFQAISEALGGDAFIRVANLAWPWIPTVRHVVWDVSCDGLSRTFLCRLETFPPPPSPETKKRGYWTLRKRGVFIPDCAILVHRTLSRASEARAFAAMASRDPQPKAPEELKEGGRVQVRRHPGVKAPTSVQMTFRGRKERGQARRCQGSRRKHGNETVERPLSDRM